MTIPSENKKILTELGRVDQYSWERPAFIPPRINFTSYSAAKYILERGQEFNVMWGEATAHFMGEEGYNFMLSGDKPSHGQQRKTMGASLYRENWHEQIKAFYEDITLRLLHKHSSKIVGINQVDITRESVFRFQQVCYSNLLNSVGNLAHVHFAANMFSLPLKSEEHPRGVYSEHELYMVLAVLFVGIFFDLDPVKSFPLRMAAKAVTQQLGKLVEVNVNTVNLTGFISGVVDSFRQENNALKDYGVHMVRRLLESGLTVKQATWSQIVPTAGAMVANQAQVVCDYHHSFLLLIFFSSLNCLIIICQRKERFIFQKSIGSLNWIRPKLMTRYSTMQWKESVSTVPSALIANLRLRRPLRMEIVKSESDLVTRCSLVLSVPTAKKSSSPSPIQYASTDQWKITFIMA